MTNLMGTKTNLLVHTPNNRKDARTLDEAINLTSRNKRHSIKEPQNINLATCLQGSVVGYIVEQYIQSLQNYQWDDTAAWII